MKEQIKLIRGGSHEDARGKLFYFNDFDMSPVKRFYIIEHADVKTIRAWQGHKVEQKWFYVISGSFDVRMVQPDNWENPSPDLKPEKYFLRAADNAILSVPAGWATGFKTLAPASKLMVFSPFTIEESSNDDYRFDKNLWTVWE